MLQSLLTGCPLIEYLSLHACPGLKNLELSGLTKLNKFKVYGAEKLQRLWIKAQNVQKVTIRGPLSFQCEFNSASCEFLKHLTFSHAPIEDECLCNQISKFPLLESLLITLTVMTWRASTSLAAVLRCWRFVNVWGWLKSRLKLPMSSLKVLHFCSFVWIQYWVHAMGMQSSAGTFSLLY